MTDAEVAVVGAGITGLAVAHYLAEREVDTVVFEAGDEAGGVMRSKRVDGRVLDLGPQRTRMSPRVEALVDDLDLRDSLLSAPEDLPLYVYIDGELRLAPTSALDAARTSLLSWRAKLRVLAEPTKNLSDVDYETAEEFMRHRFGGEAYEKLLGPLYGGIYASDPGKMPFDRSVGRLLEERGVDGSVLLWAAKKVLAGVDPPPAVSFEDGMGKLPRALARRHDVRLDSPADAVREAGDGGWKVEAGEKEASVDEVVVATPADAAAEVVSEVSPESSEALSNLTYNELAVVHVDCDTDVYGFGFQTAFDEDLDLLGATFQGPTFGRDDLYACYLGGGRRSEVMESDDEELGRLAADELERVVEGDAEPLHVHRVEMPAYDRSWRHLDDVDLPDDVHLVGSYVSRPGVPGRLREAEAVAEEIATR